MSCLNCDAKVGANLRLNNIEANSKVRAGDDYTISFDVKNIHWLIFIYGRACLYEGNTVIANSGSFKISKGDTLGVTFTGRMPNKPLDLKISVVAEAAGYIKICEDSAELYIDLAGPGESTEPPTKIKIEEEFSITEWIEENPIIIIGVIAILGMFVMMMRR